MRAVWRLGHRPELDGLRGIAILLVVAEHVLDYEFGWSLRAFGAVGVDVFFTLSGFLITEILVREHAETGSISFVRFYRRRARRLMPPLAVLLLVLVTLRATMATDIAPTIWPTVLYVANWVCSVGGHNLVALNPTWTLAVEEQFYLVWPVALLLALRWRRGPEALACAVIVLSAVERFAFHADGRAYGGSDTQAGPLLVGALLAILAHRGLPALRSGSPAVPGCLVVGLLGVLPLQSLWVLHRLLPTLLPVVTAALIWSALSFPGGALAWRWLGHLGRRSYAVYLWNRPILFLANLAGGKGAAQGLVVVLLVLGVAELSWRYVERPVLGRGRSPRPHVTDEHREVLVAPISAA